MLFALTMMLPSPLVCSEEDYSIVVNAQIQIVSICSKGAFMTALIWSAQ